MTALVKLAERFTETAIDDEIVIMRVDSGEFFALSGPAAAIWRLIDGKRDVEAVREALASEFAAGQAELTEDVAQFLSELRDAGLVAEG